MTDIRRTLSVIKNIQSFVDYMWTKYCRDFFGDSCLDSQKRHIQKYRMGMPTIPQDQILTDLSNFAQSRGSNLITEFREWIRSLSDIEFKLVMLRKKGGKRQSRKYRKTRRLRTRKH